MDEQDRQRSRYSADYNREDEISLIDLWLVLSRRKWWLFGTLGAVIALAVVYVAITPAVYESQGSVEVGLLGGELIESGESLLPRLRQVHQVGRGGVPLPRVMRVDGEERLITFEARGATPEDAARAVEEAIQGLVERHGRMYEDYREDRETRLESIDRRITALETQLDTLSSRIEQMSTDETAMASLLTLEQRLSTQLPELERDRHELAGYLSAHMTTPTEAIANPEPPRSPAAPRVTLILALAVIVGTLLGIFIAFFREFLANARAAMGSSLVIYS